MSITYLTSTNTASIIFKLQELKSSYKEANSDCDIPAAWKTIHDKANDNVKNLNN